MLKSGTLIRVPDFFVVFCRKLQENASYYVKKFPLFSHDSTKTPIPLKMLW
jgi:hypothetical protein